MRRKEKAHEKKKQKAILAISLAAAMMAGTSFTSFAATAQDVIAKSQGHTPPEQILYMEQNLHRIS